MIIGKLSVMAQGDDWPARRFACSGASLWFSS